MIWIRRFLTLPLGLLLFVLLLIALVLLQVNDSFLNAQYYPDELSKADIYRFALVDVATSVLDEARELDVEDLPEGLDENPLVTSGVSTEEIVSALNRALPPEWVQSIVEQVFDGLGRYVIGERDGFQVTVMAGDQVVTTVAEVKALLRKADAYNLLYEELVTPAIEDAVAEGLPFGLNVTSDELVASVRRVLGPDWVQAQVEAILDEVTPYAVGETDSFEINIQLSDRAEIAIEEVMSLLRQADAYDLLYDEVVAPTVLEDLAGLEELPFGITITEEEVLAALRRVAPPEWVQEQAESVIDQASPYLTGKVEGFAITVDLSENKREARTVIVETATRKFRERFDDLPTCTREQIVQVVSGGIRAFPECIPPGGQARRFIEQEGNRLLREVVAQVDPVILGAIPGEITFTDAVLRDELRRAGSQVSLDVLDDMREIIRDGWTYNDADLRRDLRDVANDDAVELMDDVRAFLADGWTYTERDLREDIEGIGDANALKNFDLGRDILSAARKWSFLIYIPAVLLLVIIGLLGGRSWPQRIAWAATFLVITSGALFVIWGPAYQTVGESRLLDDYLDDFEQDVLRDVSFDGGFEGTQRLVMDKAIEMIKSVADGFAGGIAAKSLVLAIAGLIALGVSIFWASIVGLVRQLGL